jgi:hypothetical protein
VDGKLPEHLAALPSVGSGVDGPIANGRSQCRREVWHQLADLHPSPFTLVFGSQAVEAIHNRTP